MILRSYIDLSVGWYRCDVWKKETDLVISIYLFHLYSVIVFTTYEKYRAKNYLLPLSVEVDKMKYRIYHVYLIYLGPLAKAHSC